MSATSVAETKPETLNTAYFIAQTLQRSLGYAERVLSDIPAEKFAHNTIANCNHPAFIVGHLALYPNRILTLLGREDLATDLAPNWSAWQEMFKAGSPCLSDASKYPSKDVLTKAFFDGHRKLLEVLPQISDEMLRRDNPMEGRMREMFPKIGIAVNFMCTSHLMMHLGQISTWRRSIGLGSAM